MNYVRNERLVPLSSDLIVPQYPKICREEVSIHVIQSRSHILNTVRQYRSHDTFILSISFKQYSEAISKYAEVHIAFSFGRIADVTPKRRTNLKGSMSMSSRQLGKYRILRSFSSQELRVSLGSSLFTPTMSPIQLAHQKEKSPSMNSPPILFCGPLE